MLRVENPELDAADALIPAALPLPIELEDEAPANVFSVNKLAAASIVDETAAPLSDDENAVVDDIPKLRCKSFILIQVSTYMNTSHNTTVWIHIPRSGREFMRLLI